MDAGAVGETVPVDCMVIAFLPGVSGADWIGAVVEWAGGGAVASTVGGSRDVVTTVSSLVTGLPGCGPGEAVPVERGTSGLGKAVVGAGSLSEPDTVFKPFELCDFVPALLLELLLVHMVVTDAEVALGPFLIIVASSEVVDSVVRCLLDLGVLCNGEAGSKAVDSVTVLLARELLRIVVAESPVVDPIPALLALMLLCVVATYSSVVDSVTGCLLTLALCGIVVTCSETVDSVTGLLARELLRSVVADARAVDSVTKWLLKSGLPRNVVVD